MITPMKDSRHSRYWAKEGSLHRLRRLSRTDRDLVCFLRSPVSMMHFMVVLPPHFSLI
jgi:hypothetical protein